MKESATETGIKIVIMIETHQRAVLIPTIQEIFSRYLKYLK